jgi:hypothetical protein
VRGVEHQEAHPVEDALADALDDLVAHLVVGRVAPPREHVGVV